MTTKVKGTAGIEFPDATVQSSAATIEKVVGINGTSFKYPDGTMVFYGRTSFTPAAFIGSANQWYSEVTVPFNFPVPFVSAPAIQMGVLDQNIALRSAYCSFATPTTGAVTQAFLYSPATANPGVATIVLTCIAWGRWKA